MNKHKLPTGIKAVLAATCGSTETGARRGDGNPSNVASSAQLLRPALATTGAVYEPALPHGVLLLQLDLGIHHHKIWNLSSWKDSMHGVVVLEALVTAVHMGAHAAAQAARELLNEAARSEQQRREHYRCVLPVRSVPSVTVSCIYLISFFYLIFLCRPHQAMRATRETESVGAYNGG